MILVVELHPLQAHHGFSFYLMKGIHLHKQAIFVAFYCYCFGFVFLGLMRSN